VKSVAARLDLMKREGGINGRDDKSNGVDIRMYLMVGYVWCQPNKKMDSRPFLKHCFLSNPTRTPFLDVYLKKEILINLILRRGRLTVVDVFTKSRGE
jgi:hypothetical protein